MDALYFVGMVVVIGMLKIILDLVEPPRAKKQGVEPLPPGDSQES